MKKKQLVTCITLLVFFVITILLVVMNKSAFIDDNLYNLIRKVSSPGIDKFMVFVTKLGNAIEIAGIVLIFLLIFRNWYGIFLTLSSGVSVATNSIIKYIIRRIRPDHLRLIKQGGYSFPSGHAMISIAVYGAFLYLVIKKIKNKVLKTILSILLIFIILGIGISRVYVGVHYPTDVIAGYLLGIIELIIIIAIFNGRGLFNEKNSV